MVMNVILRHAASGFCYGGRGYWVNGPELALDLRTIEDAVEAAREEDFGGMEVVAGFGDPECELVLPLRRNGTSRGKAPARSLSGGCQPAPRSLSQATSRLPPPSRAPGLT
jgi:hypothetical protein